MVPAVTSATSPTSSEPSTLALDEASPRRTAIRDLVELTKPRITMVVLVTMAPGMKLAAAGAPISAAKWLWTMLGAALVVGAANTLNMWLERDVDGLMARTKNRPLPAGRMEPMHALLFGLFLSVTSLPILTFAVNPMTGLLGAIALASYVLVYTPMKRRSSWALWVGAVPGALPPLMGWTSITGRLDRAGVALFALMFVWQIPHFLAISLFRTADYDRAGLKIVPVEKGERATKWMVLRYAMLLTLVSLWPVHEGIGGRLYAVLAMLFGSGFVIWAALGLRPSSGVKWARSVFAYSILYIVAVFVALVATS